MAFALHTHTHTHDVHCTHNLQLLEQSFYLPYLFLFVSNKSHVSAELRQGRGACIHMTSGGGPLSPTEALAGQECEGIQGVWMPGLRQELLSGPSSTSAKPPATWLPKVLMSEHCVSNEGRRD